MRLRRWRLPLNEFDPVALLRVLADHEVEFLVIGGVAARLRGAPLVTQDVDITPAGDRPNLERLVAALGEMEATLRTATDPAGVAFPFDAGLLASGSIWTLSTRFGDLDLVLAPDGTAGFGDVAADAELLRVAIEPDLWVRVASLFDIIRSKEASGRHKDLAALPLLRRTLDESA